MISFGLFFFFYQTNVFLIKQQNCIDWKTVFSATKEQERKVAFRERLVAFFYSFNQAVLPPSGLMEKSELCTELCFLLLRVLMVTAVVFSLATSVHLLTKNVFVQPKLNSQLVLIYCLICLVWCHRCVGVQCNWKVTVQRYLGEVVCRLLNCAFFLTSRGL